VQEAFERKNCDNLRSQRRLECKDLPGGSWMLGVCCNIYHKADEGSGHQQVNHTPGHQGNIKGGRGYGSKGKTLPGLQHKEGSTHAEGSGSGAPETTAGPTGDVVGS